MPSENSMIISLKEKISKLPCTRIKKLWSSATNRDIDILIVTYGIACFYEIKVAGEKPTAWQYNRLAWWAKSGAVTGWYDNVKNLVSVIPTVPDKFDAEYNVALAAQWAALAVKASK